MKQITIPQGYKHKHYQGGQSPITELQGMKEGFFIKIFFINTDVNLRYWQVTWESIVADMPDVLGVPIVMQSDLEHPTFAVQNLFARGYIVDYAVNEKKKEATVTARILDPNTIRLIQSGKIKYCSPSVVARGNLHMRRLPSGVDLIDRFIPLHLALVANPAYGATAKLHGTCTGTGQHCTAKLKQLTASAAGKLLTAANQKEIEEITKTENPKKLKQLVASCNRLQSELNQIHRGTPQPEHNNQWGHWIRSHDLDVFVASDSKSTADQIKNQCKCG